MGVTTIVIAIGNSDDKLTQREWAELIQHFEDWIDYYQESVPFTVHGRWFSAPDAPWQNAAWSIAWPDDQITIVRSFKRALRDVLAKYRQDTMAWTTGNTELIPATAFEKEVS
jgi:hypothetical protein